MKLLWDVLRITDYQNYIISLHNHHRKRKKRKFYFEENEIAVPIKNVCFFEIIRPQNRAVVVCV